MQDVIKPLTRHLGCRFVELESQIGAGSACALASAAAATAVGGGGGGGGSAHSVVGPADAFISHNWQCPFGNLVAAAADNSRPGRKVWVDIFAVNQHATMMADLAGLSDVIRTVPEGLLLVADAQAALDNQRLNPLKVRAGGPCVATAHERPPTRAVAPARDLWLSHWPCVHRTTTCPANLVCFRAHACAERWEGDRHKARQACLPRHRGCPGSTRQGVAARVEQIANRGDGRGRRRASGRRYEAGRLR